MGRELRLIRAWCTSCRLWPRARPTDTALGTVDGSPARRITVAQVSEDFFATLGVTQIMGGGLGPADDQVDRIVLSHELWRSAFGGDPGIVGRPVRLNERSLTVWERLQQAEAAQRENESDVRRATLQPLRDELTRGLRALVRGRRHRGSLPVASRGSTD